MTIVSAAVNGTGWQLGWKFAAILIGLGVALKLIGLETGPVTILYYLVFPIGLCIWAITTVRRGGIDFHFFRSIGIGGLASLIGSSVYTVWVVINTRLIIEGPIPTLQQAMDDVELRRAAGEIVTNTVILERSIESPEFFAAVVIIQLTLWGLAWSLIAVAAASVIKKMTNA